MEFTLIHLALEAGGSQETNGVDPRVSNGGGLQPIGNPSVNTSLHARFSFYFLVA